MKNQIMVALLVIILTACAPFVETSVAPTITISPLMSPTPAYHIDLIISPKEYTQPIAINVGQILAIQPASLENKWQVTYDPDLFKSLTPVDRMPAPGFEGWLFQGVAVGQGLIVLTSIVACDQPVPCPMMPIKYELVVQVK